MSNVYSFATRQVYDVDRLEIGTAKTLMREEARREAVEYARTCACPSCRSFMSNVEGK